MPFGTSMPPPHHDTPQHDMQGPELNITINDELRSFVDPLSPIEQAALERSLLAEGCRDALVLWRDTLIDGHNRYELCQKHGIPFRTVHNNTFESIEDVMLWMIDNHLARRSVSDFQRGVLALKKKEIVSARVAERPADEAGDADAAPDAGSPPWNTREDVARAARVSSNTISQIERIQKAATPELREAVRTGTISINAAANVAQLPESAQLAAVAGGRKELQQAARQVREQKSAARPRKEKEVVDPADELATLRSERAAMKDRLATLLTENERLKQRLVNAGLGAD
ncbi:transcriptional regulator with XRE-family HTH domain [Massilia aurea]|uniref:Transcriptional regulator with XRE-family HTH domain n=1 Tax=Massilia aurea TaxID=373040 RepID=A0A7W9WXZ3_9BURK|nr:transcriptional regulator with XRE-family HTH domain [Massilia aurea]